MSLGGCGSLQWVGCSAIGAGARKGEASDAKGWWVFDWGLTFKLFGVGTLWLLGCSCVPVPAWAGSAVLLAVPLGTQRGVWFGA